jgi:hypothetical protein
MSAERLYIEGEPLQNLMLINNKDTTVMSVVFPCKLKMTKTTDI